MCEPLRGWTPVIFHRSATNRKCLWASQSSASSPLARREAAAGVSDSAPGRRAAGPLGLMTDEPCVGHQRCLKPTDGKQTRGGFDVKSLSAPSCGSLLKCGAAGRVSAVLQDELAGFGSLQDRSDAVKKCFTDKRQLVGCTCNCPAPLWRADLPGGACGPRAAEQPESFTQTASCVELWPTASSLPLEHRHSGPLRGQSSSTFSLDVSLHTLPVSDTSTVWSAALGSRITVQRSRFISEGGMMMMMMMIAACAPVCVCVSRRNNLQVPPLLPPES